MINDKDWQDIGERLAKLDDSLRNDEWLAAITPILEEWNLTYADYEAELERRNPTKFDERGYIILDEYK